MARHKLIITALFFMTVGMAGCSDSAGNDVDRSSSNPPPISGSWRDPQPPADPPIHQPPAGPAFLARAAEDRLYAEGRGRDQQENPDYIQRTAPWVLDYVASGQTDENIFYDPYRIDWAQTLGTEQDVEFLNRYGAKMRAKLWGPKLPYTDPLTGLASSGPFPAIIFIPGAAGAQPDSTYIGFRDYEGQLQQLAENGYIVLAVGPQGQDGSEYFTPPHPMCDPDGAWKQPQEFGLRELGECAGQNGPLPPASGEFAPLYSELGDPLLVFQLQSRVEGFDVLFDDVVAVNDAIQTRYVFAALDGVGYLLSDANPWRALVDGQRVGITGHSAGAHAALVAGNGDPQGRFKAVVAFEGYGLPPDTVSPLVPTLLQMAEGQETVGPYTEPPPIHVWPPYRNYRRFANEKRDSMLVTLRGSTHSEWYYTAYALINPVQTLYNTSSKGGQVSHYYLLAWFDRWLKPGYTENARGRLFGRSFDASADRTSIGAGTYDPATQSNVPYRLDGEAVADHLSVLFLSQANFDGASCLDFQAQCP